MKRFCFALAVLGLGCSKSEPPAPAKRTAPWPAREQPEAAPAVRSATAHFNVDARAEVRFELRGQTKAPRGVMRVARGELEVDLLDLARTRGTVSIDVASASMEGVEVEQAREDTRRAHNWLDVGASRPEAERERLRWATFTFNTLEKPSAEAAHEGQLVKAGAAEAGVGADAGSEPSPAEIRAVNFSVRGQLLLHGFRVDQSAELRALFHYPQPVSPGAIPERVVIQTRRPLVVSLKAHDIKPRDDRGVFVAQDAKLFGREVGSNASVQLALTARPTP